MHDGRMSVVRRFFCLFVTFDLVFVSLLWLICIVVCFSIASRHDISLMYCSCSTFIADRRRQYIPGVPETNNAIHNLHIAFRCSCNRSLPFRSFNIFLCNDIY